MSTPGFNAESGLYRSNFHYQTLGFAGWAASAGEPEQLGFGETAGRSANPSAGPGNIWGTDAQYGRPSGGSLAARLSLFGVVWNYPTPFGRACPAPQVRCGRLCCLQACDTVTGTCCPPQRTCGRQCLPNGMKCCTNPVTKALGSCPEGQECCFDSDVPYCRDPLLEQCCFGEPCSNLNRCCPNGDCLPENDFNCGPNCTNCVQAGKICCNSECVDPSKDPNNCGKCGTACSSGQVCCNGTCGIVCGNTCCPEPGNTCCTGQCANTLSDPKNCGTCGNDCGPNGVCCSGKCLPAQECCNGQECTPEQICCNGQECCGPAPAQLCCENGCVPSDTSNCGVCGNKCSGGQKCCPLTGACCQASDICCPVPPPGCCPPSLPFCSGGAGLCCDDTKCCLPDGTQCR